MRIVKLAIAEGDASASLLGTAAWSCEINLLAKLASDNFLP